MSLDAASRQCGESSTIKQRTDTQYRMPDVSDLRAPPEAQGSTRKSLVILTVKGLRGAAQGRNCDGVTVCRVNPGGTMRRYLLLAGIAVLALTVGSAAAKTVTVTITKNGYVPNSAAIAQGDTVQFTNSDTVVHQVTFKSTTGVTCTPNPLVVQPGSSGTC